MKAQLSSLKNKMKKGSLYAQRFRETIKSGSDFDINGENDELLIMASDDSWEVDYYSLEELQNPIIGADEEEELNPNDIAFDASINVIHLVPITGAYMEFKLNEVAKNMGWDPFFKV